MTSHSAAGPALGYLYQFQSALTELIPYALSGSDALATLEVFDDVAFDFGQGDARSVLQVHHSLKSEHDLIDTSAKVWRTFAIWADEWRSLNANETRVMTLLTTLVARTGSGIESLTSHHRDINHAVQTLTKVAEDEDGSASTASDRQIFLNLEAHERAAMLNNVTVADSSLKATEMRARLLELLAPTHETRFVESMADSVEGWWWPRVVAALAEKRSIRADEVRVAIDEARRSLSERALPILQMGSFQSNEFPTVDTDSARFLQSLKAVQAGSVRLNQALDDYRRAFAHRSRWGRRGLLGPGEYERYEDDLFSQWLIASDRMLRKLHGDEDATSLASAGHELWDTMESDVREPLRPETTDGFIQRGSLHQLAEVERLAWHPSAAEEIRESLEEESAA